MRATVAVLGLVGLLFLRPAAAPASGEKPQAGKGAKELAADFIYPGAERLATAASPADEGPGIFAAKYTTPDGPEKVLAWYRKQMGIPPGEGIGVNPGNRPGVRQAWLNDSRQPGKKGQVIGDTRSVSLVVLLKKTNDFTVNVVVSRTADEAVTHIVVTLVDNKRQ
jgi:hypothetical protein